MCEERSRFDTKPNGRCYGYDKKSGWDIDTSERTQRESDGGHIPGGSQIEETVQVSNDDDE